MTTLTGVTINDVAFPNNSNALQFEEATLWACMAYHKLFKDITYQSEQFIERLTFSQKTIYRRVDLPQDVLVYTLHFPMSSSAISGQEDWDTSNLLGAGRWNYAVQPTTDTALALPVNYLAIQ